MKSKTKNIFTALKLFSALSVITLPPQAFADAQSADQSDEQKTSPAASDTKENVPTNEKPNEQGWITDFETAKTRAAAEGKDILMNFTGSDWCHWCIQLHEEVFSKEYFQTNVKKDFILLELDFPNNKKQAPEIKTQNERLRDTLGVEGYPTVFLADKNGTPYAKTGYQEGGPEKYITHLANFRKFHAIYKENIKKADSASGLERARLLDNAIALSDLEDTFNNHSKIVDEIIALDSENEAGLKQKYEFMQSQVQLIHTLRNSIRAQQIDKGIGEIEKFIETNNPTGSDQQWALGFKMHLYIMQGNNETAKTVAKEIIDIDKDSEYGKMANEALNQL